jgi:ParB family chromosome partitioning protein
MALRSDIALTAGENPLALPMFFPHERDSCLDLRLDSTSLHSSAEGIEDSPAGKALAEAHAAWLRRLPRTPEALWDWLLAQDQAARLDLLATCAGCSVNAVRKRHDRADNDRLAHADRLAVGLDMSQWWQPTAASYLRSVTKAMILEAVREAVIPEAADNLAALKKDALTAEAERRLSGTGWLPAVLRAPAAVHQAPALEAAAAE